MPSAEYDQGQYTIPGGRVVVTERDGETVDVLVAGPTFYSAAGAANAVRDGSLTPYLPRRGELNRLAALIRESTAARGVDIYAVEECGLSAAEWARMTGRDRSTVSRNVRRARD